MRLIGSFTKEKQLLGFQQCLQREGITSLYDFDRSKSLYHLWVIEEELFEQAYNLYGEWEKNPSDSRFYLKDKPLSPSPPPDILHSPHHKRSRRVTWMVIFLCATLFLLNVAQRSQMQEGREEGMAYIGFTPVQKELFFDYPVYLEKLGDFLNDHPIESLDDVKMLSPEAQARFKEIREIPTWKGFIDLLRVKSWKSYEELPRGTLFRKIRQGEVWRLITPVFLHVNFFHILFNMLGLWVLSNQIETRVGALRLVLLSLLIGITSNIAQYLVSGPIFVGYSGIVVGMVGFIWMRKRVAPWEGYFLQRSVILYVAILVLAMWSMAVIGIFFPELFSSFANIANTAHVVGGIAGISLARIPWFSKRILS